MENFIYPGKVLLDGITFSVEPNLDIAFVIGVFLMLILSTIAIINSLAADQLN